jgi:phenylpropionate dioxygenase-like ring-hydroxylating dioxygenase large terminal subunit
MAEADPALLVEDARVHSRVYTDPAVFALERERLWRRAWLYLCHDSQVPAAGDFYATDLAGTPVVAVRQRDGGVAALVNRCRHRGALVCQGETGRAGRLRCPYHGWTYALDGRLVGVPLKAPDFALGDPALDLAPVPRLAAYRGFWFVSFAATGPDLAAYLGPIASALDDIVDRAPEGAVEVVGRPQRHFYRGNWKFQIENLQDYIHPTFAHESSNAAARPGERRPGEAGAAGLQADDVMAANAAADFAWIEKAGVWAFPFGHSYIGGLPVKAPIPPADEAQYKAALAARHGAAKAEAVLAVNRHQAIVYPSLTVQAAFQYIKIVRPIRADLTELVVYSLRLKGAPESYHRASVAFCNAASAAASPILTDDLAIYERAQRALEGAPGWVRFPMHAGRDAPDNAPPGSAGGAAGGWRAPGYSELAMRNQFAAWRAAIAEGDPAGRRPDTPA